jgi:hypothetical protein
MRQSRSYLTGLLVLLFAISGATQPQLELQPFATGLNQPIDIVNAGDDRLFVIQQRGLIRIIDADGTVHSDPFLDLTALVSQSGNERGLLSLVFHPGYDENGFFFVNYTRQEDGATVVARYSADADNPDQGDPDSAKEILTIDQPFANHNGGQLLFGPDGYLYIATGDGGSGGDPEDYAQTHTTLLGKMLRIDIDVDDESPYAIPEDNPFAHDDFTRDEIWALGLRNHWRNSFDRYTGDFWIADVGQNEREEVNFQPADSEGGENYGWRCYEGSIPYNLDGCGDTDYYTFPVFEYGHIGSGCSGSVTGGYVYRGAVNNGMFGHYIFADYCTGNFYHIIPTEEGFEGALLDGFSPLQYATFGEDRYGELYVALRGEGEIRRVVETSDCGPVARIKNAVSPIHLESGESVTLEAFYHPSLDYQWHREEMPLEGQTGPSLEVTEPGVYSVSVTNPGNHCSNTSEPVEVTMEGVSAALPQQEGTRVFPNPASQYLHIEGLPATGTSNIRVLDLLGKTVFQQEVSNEINVTIKTREWPAGFYLLQVHNNSGTFLEKIVIQPQ